MVGLDRCAWRLESDAKVVIINGSISSLSACQFDAVLSSTLQPPVYEWRLKERITMKNDLLRAAIQTSATACLAMFTITAAFCDQPVVIGNRLELFFEDHLIDLSLIHI